MYFFDLDGTLLDSNWIWLDIDREFLGGLGCPVTEEYTWYVTHHSAPQAAEYTRDYCRLDKTPQEIMGIWIEMARTAYGQRLELKAGAREFLLSCRAAGHGTALLTSCIPQLCQAALDRHGLRPLLDHVLTTQQLGLEKSDSNLYRRAASLCGAQAETCVLFDDSPVALAAAPEVKRACHQYWHAFPLDGGGVL